MHSNTIHCLNGTALALLLAGPSATANWCPPESADDANPTPIATTAPRIEVCFVLDTTGSMSGLIEGAKLKIWSIANELIAATPTPEVRIGLVGYRDRSDAYVTRTTALTDDIDAIYADLQRYEAGGGGDWPESVNQALHEAVTTMPWSNENDVLKLVFLVGDAPPQMNYADDVKYHDICRFAMQRGLIINTVQCGDAEDTRKVWQKIAMLSEGSYVAIEQSGNMTVTSTPYDEELARLNVEVGETIVAYGTREQRDSVKIKQAVSESAPGAAAADRLAFNRSSGRVVQGDGDLIDALARGEVKLEELKDEELPEELRGQSIEAQRAVLDEIARRRAAIRTQINELLKRRGDFIEAERQRLAQADGGDSFDAHVAEVVREQAARKGIQFEDVANEE